MSSTSDNSLAPSSNALRSLIAFAAARSYSVNTNNPLNSILPLFEPIAAQLHGRQFIAKDLSDELLGRYDLIVSEDLCSYWAEQLVKQELLVPVISASGTGTFEWSQPRVANTPDGAFGAELAAILTALRDFSSTSGDLITSSFDDEQLVTLLRRGAIASMFPKLHSGNNPVHNSEDEYIFSRFVEHVAKNNILVLDSISKLRRAVIYSDLILHLREPKIPTGSSQNVFAYLDSPLVMDLIGLGGKLRKAFAERLVKTLSEIKIIALISPVMIEEIGGNIKALLARDPRHRFGPTAQALRHGDFKIDFVEACLDRIESLVEESGIQIDRGFSTYLKSQFDADGKNLEQELLSKLQSHYKMFGAAERDAESLFGCFGRRAGHRPRDMYSSRCFFVTSNSMLATVGNKYFRENHGYGERTFPIVVTRSAIAAMADAVHGVAVRGSMTEQELLISAADATSYHPAIFDRIEKFLETLSPQDADDLGAIIQRTDLSDLAMDIFRGNPGNVTSQRVSELVDTVKTRLETEAEQRALERIQKERSATQVKIEGLESVSSEKDAKIHSLVNTAKKQHAVAVKLISDRNLRSQRLVSHSRSLFALFAVTMAGLVGFSVYAVSLFAESLEQNARFLYSLVAAVAAGLPFAGLPPVRAAFSQAIERYGAIRVSTLATRLGYSCPDDRLIPADDLLATLEQQFTAAELAHLTPPTKGDLFGK